MDQKDRYALEDDAITEQKREAVRQKLSLICKKDENIDEILKSLEAYCLIVVNSHYLYAL
jgi:ATP-dependent protease HslVU (ClpYQ) peptidase subunit